MDLSWTVLEDTTLSGTLLASLRSLWDPASPPPTSRSSLLDLVERKTAVLATEGRATTDGRTVGAVVGGFSEAERVAVLDYVFVAGPLRGRGHGQRLVDRLLAELAPHADIVFSDAEDVSESFLRSMGWRLLTADTGLGWIARSGRLTVFPRTPERVPSRLAVKILRPMNVEKTVTLGHSVQSAPDNGWTHAIVAAIMRGDLDLRDLDESMSRAVHASLATRRTP